MRRTYDRVIIGAGLYGLYAALKSVELGFSVLVVECDSAPFTRATYVNQARVHQGYHYPRSLHTANKTATYFDRFNKEFGFCINRSFKQIYATSARMSWTDANQFKDFCRAVGIACEELDPSRYFKTNMCDGAFRTQEYTYDAKMLLHHLRDNLEGFQNFGIELDVRPIRISRDSDRFLLKLDNGELLETRFLLNASYASVNQLLDIASIGQMDLKYELCEIAICRPNKRLMDYGFTVMDGPFFSIMPFGFTGYHSLTSVSFTPHETSHERLPSFSCQKRSSGYCTPEHLGNCNECIAKPRTSYKFMSNLANKYLKDEFVFEYVKSLYSMKPVFKSSEIDDSRPTVVSVHSKNPDFISVLSGKISTIYDLDEVLGYGR